VDIATLSADKDMKIVRFGALGFRNIADTMAFVQKTPGSEKFELLTDIYQFTMLMQKEIHGEAKFLKLLRSLQDIGLKTVWEAMLIDAFSNPLPPLFHDPDKGIPTKDEPSFLRYNEYKQWKDQLELLHTTIITVQLSLETLINTFWCRILWHTLLPSWLSSTIR